MNVTSSEIAITIVLPEASVIQLMEALNPLASALCVGAEKSHIVQNPALPKRSVRESSTTVTARPSGKYSCELLGEVLSASTLPGVFAAVIDLVDELDPAILEKLSVMRPSSARKYISRHRENVHAWSPQLPTLRTESLWWISKNISRDQLIRALRALCDASSLEFGKDLRFQ